MGVRTQTQLSTCQDATTIQNLGGEVVTNSDGSVSVYMPDSSGSLVPIILTKPCCEALNSDYIFDIDQQKCLWKDTSQGCGLNSIFKLVLNPKGNDGTIFVVEDNETCYLSVDFDYLFKVNCDTISSMIAGKQVGGTIGTLGTSSSVSVGTISLSGREILGQIAEQQSICDKYQYELEGLLAQIAATPYSIECIFKQESIESVPVTTGLIKSFGKTAFDRNSTIAPFSLLFANSVGTFCLSEPDGLSQWQNQLGSVRYQNFINGDPNSYSCSDVQAIVDYNANIVLKGGAPIINECNVPFGTKTALINQYNNVLKQQAECNAIIADRQIKLDALQLSEVIDSQSGAQKCSSPIDFFESFSVSMTVDMVTSANTLETVYEQPLFGPIGSGNLYAYLTANTNSGFYVCGDPNITETSFSGCSPMFFEFDGTDVDNVTACQGVMTNLLNALFTESGLSGSTTGNTTFQNSLSYSALSSNWLHFHTLITDPNILAQIANQKIKISFKINSSCGNFCVLVDEISLNRECTKVDKTEIFITQPPGFNLERIRDNKKSWVGYHSPQNRPFDIKNVLGTNAIRQTNYDVNDERLVINSKEIDLDINIAEGVEHDVWCYISDNPCILSGTCTPLQVTCPNGYTRMGDSYTCQKIEYTAVTSAVTVYTAIAGAKRCDSTVTYGENGGVFYPDLTTLTLPLGVSGGSLHNQSVVIDANNNIVSIQATALNTLWGNGSGNCIGPCTSSCSGYNNRINKIGLWTSPSAPDTEWIGWSFCVDIPSDGVYTIGVGADDACRVKVNGVSTFSFTGAGWNFLAFRMFPITLSAGLNIIEMEIMNSGGGSATLAAEIYSANTNIISGITNESDLTPYIVFSTGNYIGQNWQIGENSGFSCPDGYALNTCVNPYTCTKISKTGATTEGDCCDPCFVFTGDTCGNKQFQDNLCFEFMDAQVYEFMDGNFVGPSGTTTLNGSNCCGDEIDFNDLLSQPLTAVTIIEDFEYFLTSELIDAKNRQTISQYPTLKALYERYLNSLDYCDTKSSAFNYMTMDQFAGLIDSYWVDIVEQVIPATTIWGSVKVYGNTIFDQQKFAYKSYSSLFCGNPYSGMTILSPINGISGKCTNVEVITTTINLATNPNVRMKNPTTICNTVCQAQMNVGSEFIGSVNIVSASPNDCAVSSGRQIGSIAINECSLQVSISVNYPTATAVVVGATGDVNYEWSNGETTPSIVLTGAGTYSVIVTDAACCSAQSQINATVPNQNMTACWYSFVERPEFILDTFYCSLITSAITFNVDSLIVNGSETITDSGYTKTITSADTTWVSASNTILSGCGPTYTTGVTYSDYVALLNEVFTDLGLTDYKAQLSYTNRIITDFNGNPLSPAGFYIIRPLADTFEIRTSSSLLGTLKYKTTEITDTFNNQASYYAVTCNGITLENGTVVE